MQQPLYSVRSLSTGKVSIMRHPRGKNKLATEIKTLRATGVDILVSLLTVPETTELGLEQEAICCADQGILFFSFPIADFSVPPFSPQTFRFLAQLNNYLFQGKHLALHCYQGIGRSGLMAASLLTLAGQSPEQAFKLLSQVRGCPVPETIEQREWVITFSQRQPPR